MLSCSGQGWLSQVGPCLFFLSTVLEQQCSLCPWCSGDMSYVLRFVNTLNVQSAPPYTPNMVSSKALLFVLASGLRTILHNLQILSIHFASPFLPPDCQRYLSQRSFCFDWKFPKVSSDVSFPPRVLSLGAGLSSALTQILPFFPGCTKTSHPNLSWRKNAGHAQRREHHQVSLQPSGMLWGPEGAPTAAGRIFSMT